MLGQPARSTPLEGHSVRAAGVEALVEVAEEVVALVVEAAGEHSVWASVALVEAWALAVVVEEAHTRGFQ